MYEQERKEPKCSGAVGELSKNSGNPCGNRESPGFYQTGEKNGLQSQGSPPTQSPQPMCEEFQEHCGEEIREVHGGGAKLAIPSINTNSAHLYPMGDTWQALRKGLSFV